MNTKSHQLSVNQLLCLLFSSFFKIALFVVGGGPAMIPAIEQLFVQEKKLLKERDILDMLAITQTMPGLTAVNAAIFVGHKLAGFVGAFISMVAVITPSVAIIMIIAALFKNLNVFMCESLCCCPLFRDGLSLVQKYISRTI